MNTYKPFSQARNKRAKPTPYFGPKLCDYGCQSPAKFLFANGKHCCTSSGGNCPAIKQSATEKAVATRTALDENNTSVALRASAKAAETKRQDVDPVSGKTKHQRIAELVAQRKTDNIDPETGLNIHQQTTIRYKEWLKTEKGIRVRKHVGQIVKEQQNAVDPVTGIKEAERRAKSAVLTKLADVDENGLNSIERAHWKQKPDKCGFVDGVFWQYSHERKFLESIKEAGLIEHIERGKKVRYFFEGKERTYLPDYVMGQQLFEIKSSYTMFGINSEFLPQNIAKLTAARDLGYDVVVVIDGVPQPLATLLGSLSDFAK